MALRAPRLTMAASHAAIGVGLGGKDCPPLAPASPPLAPPASSAARYRPSEAPRKADAPTAGMETAAAVVGAPTAAMGRQADRSPAPGSSSRRWASRRPVDAWREACSWKGWALAGLPSEKGGRWEG